MAFPAFKTLASSPAGHMEEVQVWWIMPLPARTCSLLFETSQYPPSLWLTTHFFRSLQFDPSLPTHPSPQSPLRTTFRFDAGNPDIFASTLRQILPPETQFSSLDFASDKYQCLSSAIWEVALKSFPHSTRTTSKPGSCPMNKWYDEECKNFHR